MSAVAFVPARAGSKRVVNKNTRLLGGRPLLFWTVRAAFDSGVFARVVCSTDDETIGRAALRAGAEWLTRPAELARDDSPDIEWVRHALDLVPCDAFAILRPTSPFRTAEMIRRAVGRFNELAGDAHSMRAVERVRQHPYKMWRIEEGTSSPSLWMHPLFDVRIGGVPGHSRPTQTLPWVYVQNASLELVWRATVENYDSISGTRIAPFFTQWPEGFDINDEEDFARAEQLAATHLRADPDRVPEAAGH